MSSQGYSASAKAMVAGGLLNLLRVFGGGVRVTAASTALAWRLEGATGIHERTAGAPETALLAAVGDVLVLLALFGALGAAMAFIRGGPEAGKRAAAQPVAPVAPQANAIVVGSR